MAPDFIFCVECESPCYVFEFSEGLITEAICEVCGNDDPDQFATPEDFESLLDST